MNKFLYNKLLITQKIHLKIYVYLKMAFKKDVNFVY
jgi:hypothetical protein